MPDRLRPIANAAGTPSTTATLVAITPTVSELRAANCNCHEPASDSYQRSDNPGGGHRSDKPLENDTITTISVGAASRKSASPASPAITEGKLTAASPV